MQVQPMKLKLLQTSAHPKSLPIKFCRTVAYTHRATRYFKWKPPLTPHRLVILTIMCHRTAILSKLLVIIITSPIWFSLMCAFAAIALAILCALLSIIIAVFATGFSLTIGGIVTLFTVYPAGIALIGAGLICIGLGGMIVMPVIRCIWRGCVSLFNKFTNFVHRFVSSKAVA